MCNAAGEEFHSASEDFMMTTECWPLKYFIDNFSHVFKKRMKYDSAIVTTGLPHFFHTFDLMEGLLLYMQKNCYQTDSNWIAVKYFYDF